MFDLHSLLFQSSVKLLQQNELTPDLVATAIFGSALTTKTVSEFSGCFGGHREQDFASCSAIL